MEQIDEHPVGRGLGEGSRGPEERDGGLVRRVGEDEHLFEPALAAILEEGSDEGGSHATSAEPFVHADLVEEHLLPTRRDLKERGTPEESHRIAPLEGEEEKVSVVREIAADRGEIRRRIEEIRRAQDRELVPRDQAPRSPTWELGRLRSPARRPDPVQGTSK
jgi:hypothetical protein